MGSALTRELGIMIVGVSWDEVLLLCLCYDSADLALSGCNTFVHALLLLSLLGCTFCQAAELKRMRLPGRIERLVMRRFCESGHWLPFSISPPLLLNYVLLVCVTG